MFSGVLSDKDVNMAVTAATNPAVAKDPNASGKEAVKSMEYHRRVLQSKMESEKTKQYISPSDNIMSPCTAKLNALRNKQVGKIKPKSLFAQGVVAKKLDASSSKPTPNQS